MQLRKTFRFEASHILPKHPGKCSRLHGHSWVLHVWVEGSINPDTGFVQDYADVSKVVGPLVDRLDHKHLGTWNDELLPWRPSWDPFVKEELYPSSENLLWWIADQLKPLDVYKDGVLTSNWSKVALEETCTSYAELTRDEYEKQKGPSSISLRTPDVT